MQAEYDALGDEIDRITSYTEFNGISLLDGEMSANAAQLLMSDQAVANFKQLDISADGRYVVYENQTDGTIEQMDTVTGQVTVIATANVGALAQSASGNKVVFGTAANLTGEDPSGFSQIYVWDRATGEIEQITDSANFELFFDGSIYGISTSADGSTIAFTSATRYNSDGSVSSYNGGSLTITTVDLETGQFTDLGLSITSAVTFMSLSANGSRIAYHSNSDPLGTNGDLNLELFTGSTTDANDVTQVTTTTGAHTLVGVQVANDGTVYFVGSMDYTGQNSSLEAQVFAYSALTDTLSQITNSTSGYIVLDRMSADQDKIYFRATSDLAGEGTNGVYQAFSLDIGSGEFTQFTNYTTSVLNQIGRVSGDGRYQVQFNGSNQLMLVDLTPDEKSVSISTGTGAEGVINAVLSDIASAVGGNGAFLLSSATEALGALESATESIERLALVSGTLGAGLSRLEVANRHLSMEAQLKEEARARITDVDVAMTVAEMIREQVLQQAITALLAQANSERDLVLDLLR